MKHDQRLAPVINRHLPMAGLILAGVLIGTTWAQSDLPSGGEPLLAAGALFTTPVSGLERSRATTDIVPVTGQPFDRALHVTIGANASENNATQLTIRNSASVAKGDALLASLHVRGTSAAGHTPARLEFLFEKSERPWTKSVMRGIAASQQPGRWKHVLIPFLSVGDFSPGQAMVSLRFAFAPQTLEVANLRVVNYKRSKTSDELYELVAEQAPLGVVPVSVDLQDIRQTMDGFGGNFAQPRYGSTVPMDAIGRYNLDHLNVVHARVGIPLNHWAPEKGTYKNDGPARAALLQMKMMAVRKIPITGSVWEGPLWMLPGTPEQPRTLPPEHYADCIEAIARFLVIARDEYGATVEYFSFNEPDLGVNFKFAPEEMADFIREAGPRFAALGLTTRFLTADTAGGRQCADYARRLLEDESIAPYLGPLAFHCWDALEVPESRYAAIAALGRQYGKRVWCTEAGHDAALWRAPNPWMSWENALRTALAYERTLRLSGAEQMDYWTYQDNYPLVSRDGADPFPVWQVLHQMEAVLVPGSRVATALVDHDDLKVLPVVGPHPERVALVLVNPVGTGEARLTGLPSDAGLAVVQSTRHAPGRIVSAPLRTDHAGCVTVALPARSVVTLLGRDQLPAR